MKLRIAFDVDDTLIIPSVATMGEGDRPFVEGIYVGRNESKERCDGR